jgi:hypothetical protein
VNVLGIDLPSADSRRTVSTTVRLTLVPCSHMDDDAICESAVALFGHSHVAVMEDDGTSFVLFGHPSVPTGAFTEA